MSTSKVIIPVRASLQLITTTFEVTAEWDDASGDALLESGVSSYLIVRNDGDEGVEVRVDEGEWLLVPRKGRLKVTADLSTETVSFRRVQFPAGGPPNVLALFIYGLPSTLIVGEGGGAGVEDLEWLLPLVAGGALHADGNLAWEDLRFPAQGINPAGAASPPAVDDVLTSFSGTLLFSGSQENVIAGVAQMPHSWAVGTALRPHIHWSKPVGSSAAVTWEFYYRHLGSAGDVAGAWVGPVVGTLAAGDQTVTNNQLLTTFGTVDMTGKVESTMLCWQLRRQGAADANNGTARLLELDFHYQTNKRGTVPEFPT